tara:strand:- start:1615 stop:1881 length:267 start_codon:yes stop_codon:yes gene_type:complete
MKQLTITGVIRKRFDKLYLHELEEGDVFCFNNGEIRSGKTHKVVANNYNQDGLLNWKGQLEYVDANKSNSKFKSATFSRTDCFFIRKS